MKIKLSPQRPIDNEKIEYEFNEDIVIATYKGITDTFDFTDMPDGVAGRIETELSINPIIYAEKKNGELYVELIKFIPVDATEEQRFPIHWQEV